MTWTQQRTVRHLGFPFRGCRTSVDRHEVPLGYCGPDSHDVLVEPSISPLPGYTERLELEAGLLSEMASMLGRLKRRHGAAGVGSATGILELLSGDGTMKSLRLWNMPSDSSSDGFPVLATLWADESKRFGQVAIHDGATDYVEGDEMGGFHYFNGARMDLIGPPLLYDGNGATGYTRWANSQQRLRTVAGSRNSVGVKNREYYGGFQSTPSNTNRKYNTAVGSGTQQLVRFPTGLVPPLRVATRVDGDYPAIGGQGQWAWGDQYYEAWGFEFEDGTRSMPSIPREPNAILTGGLALVTIGKAGDAGAAAPNNRYLYVPDRNVRIGPPGTKRRIKYRTNKLTAAQVAAGQVPDLTTLALCGIIDDNTTTSYNDPKGNDINLVSAGVPTLVDSLTHLDQIWQPRSRYEWAFDQRKACAYLRPNPCAIIIAPTGNAADGDVNYSAEGGWPTAVTWLVQLSQSSVGVLTLKLRTVATFGAAPTDMSIVLTGLTLQDVVDTINATTHASAAKEWRAQLVPGAGAQVLATNLAPTQVSVSGCTNFNNSPTLTVSDTTDIAEGMIINDVAWPANTYVKAKVNATTLTMSANSIAAVALARIMEFDVSSVDDLFFTDATAHSQFGNLASIGNACPVVLGFKQSYLDTFPTEKRDFMITAGGPTDRPNGANIYFSSPGCRRTVESDAGIFMGGAPLKRGCILFLSNWIGYCVNTSQSASGNDADYRIIWLDKGHGCKSPYSIVHGNGWAGCWRDDGFWITDGENSVVISGDHFRILASGASRGELAYEAGLCNAAAAADTNDYYMHAHYRDGILWLNYRVSAGVFATVAYDATTSREKQGVAQMLRDDGTPFGWSARCSYSWRSYAAGCGGAIGSVRKADGLHLYQCDDKNDKTKGGLLQEFETTGAYLDGADPVQWDIHGPTDMPGGLLKSALADQVTFLYKNTVSSGPTGVTVTIYRDQARTKSVTFALDLTTGSDFFTRKPKNPPIAGRAPAEVCEVKITGGALAAEQVFEVSGIDVPANVLASVT